MIVAIALPAPALKNSSRRQDTYRTRPRENGARAHLEELLPQPDGTPGTRHVLADKPCLPEHAIAPTDTRLDD
jgi:hypothetical protein